MLPSPPRTNIPTLTDLPLVIETPRLVLRPQRASDADAFFPYVSDPELTTMVTWAAHTDIAQTRAWIANGAEELAAGTDIVWTLEHEGKPSGCVGLHSILWAVNAVRLDRGDLGYWIARPLWGKGLMTEAVTAAMHWSFETLGLHKLTIGCFEGNAASQRVIEKVGFRFLCRREEDVWRDGKWWTHLRYELTASEWADTSRTGRFARPAT
jgi:RimJ/RimL family protein N-acetyltransferase